MTKPVSPPAESPALDPLPLVKGLASLRRLLGMYPPTHPLIAQRLEELDTIVRQHLAAAPTIEIDIIHGHVHLNGVAFQDESEAQAQIVRELTDLGVDSIHIRDGVAVDDLRSLAELLWTLRDGALEGPAMADRLSQLDVGHISIGRLVPLDTRWQMPEWPDAPTGPVDPAYAEALRRTEETFDAVASGGAIDAVTVRDLVELLINEVARSNAALSQILALKAYENLTYCHSVNVSMLSLLLGRQLGLDERLQAVLVEAALLHDIGKTKVPLQILRKPGALDRVERRLIEAHTTFGAEILAETDGLHPLTPTVALEHHREFRGGGYPDLGEAVPHAMSQIVSVADIYEALTGARSYQTPLQPEQACLVLARLAGKKLNTHMVKAFVAAVTFFPIGSVVRTSRDELGVVVRTNPRDPLHPVVALVTDSGSVSGDQVDTSHRGEDGAYERHIVETVPAQTHGLDVGGVLAAAAA
jgi:putative nucleotidyltransferase with HDIG domain